MERFYGMMPSDEIIIVNTFQTSDGSEITIEAGDNGWTIICPDGSTVFQDASIGTKKNYDKAYENLISAFPDAVEVPLNVKVKSSANIISNISIAETTHEPIPIEEIEKAWESISDVAEGGYVDMEEVKLWFAKWLDKDEEDL